MQMKRIVYSLQTENACWCRGFWISSLRRADYSIPPPYSSRRTISQQKKKKKKKDRGRQRQGRKSEGIAFDIQPPSLPPSHPFNPATAVSAILMPLNADEVKMCLKERIPVGRAAACRHGVMNTRAHTRRYCTCGTWIFKHAVPTCTSNTNSFRDVNIQMGFPAPTYGRVESLHDLSGSRPACLPKCSSSLFSLLFETETGLAEI